MRMKTPPSAIEAIGRPEVSDAHCPGRRRAVTPTPSELFAAEGTLRIMARL